MTTPEAKRQLELEDEQAELDIPILMIDAALMIFADYADIDLLPFMRRYAEEFGKGIAIGSPECILVDFLENALESSTQIPHIIRSLEIEQEISEL